MSTAHIKRTRDDARHDMKHKTEAAADSRVVEAEVHVKTRLPARCLRPPEAGFAKHIFS